VTGWPKKDCWHWKRCDVIVVSNERTLIYNDFRIFLLKQLHTFPIFLGHMCLTHHFCFLQFNTDSTQRTEINSTLLLPFAQGDFEGRLAWDARRGKTAFGQCILVFTRLGQ